VSAPGGGRDATRQRLVGGALAFAAFLWWGLCPIYFRAVRDVPALEVLAHRIAWSVVLLGAIAIATRRLPALGAALAGRRQVAALAASAALIAFNWLVFIFAVQAGRVQEASLGYFMNPLVNVALGVVFLGERLRRGQLLAVLLAAASVAWLTVRLGAAPWISLALALSFGLYGLVRKVARVDALTGLLAETTLLFPIAVAWLLRLQLTGASSLRRDGTGTDLLLLSAGVITAVPLLCFIGAARRLTLTAVGFVQYLAPSLQLALAVIAFGEPFAPARLAAFAGIWTALAIFTVESLAHRRREARAPAPLAGAGGSAVPAPE
jgi:chloramphenicol-sensitive protein RarD